MLNMSRHCSDCKLDGNCEKQKEGCFSCSEGSEKSKVRRIKDIDNRVFRVIDILDDINEQYASWDLWDKTKVIDKAVNTLKEYYEKEIIERFETTGQ